LVYGLTLEDDNSLTIDMTLTSAGCPLTDVIEDQTATALEGLVEDWRINWVWMPPWGLEKITDEGRDQLRALGFNVSSAGWARVGAWRVGGVWTLPGGRGRLPVEGRAPLRALASYVCSAFPPPGDPGTPPLRAAEGDDHARRAARPSGGRAGHRPRPADRVRA